MTPSRLRGALPGLGDATSPARPETPLAPRRLAEIYPYGV
jgi:hypothetical protein